MGLPLKKADRRYTYADYKEWPDEERWELINGIAWNMSPAPNRRHQNHGRTKESSSIYMKSTVYGNTG